MTNVKLTVRGKEHEVEFLASSGEARVVSVNGHPYRVTVRGSRAVAAAPQAARRAAPAIGSAPTQAAPRAIKP